ncbi:hypothetical protein SLS64_011711 [Diaporthe eres]|uniref:Uncharacterized protein n=1 Tax=Diaporthe eres TaxID=83184 RepID=A0ABR1PIY4_DIAER
MAGENLIDNPRDWGHVKSPFFKLPPEIRNKIYRETFTASEVALVIDPPLHVHVVPVTGRRSIFNTTNSNHHFLLTCVQVYLEALALYWSTAVVRNGCEGHFSRGYFLNRIPAIAKPFIQHLRDVNGAPSRGSRWLRGQLIRWSASLAESFDEFPNLKSCLIKDWRRGHSRNLIVPYEIDQAVARHPNVHIIEKDITWETDPPDPGFGPIRRFPSGYPVLVRQHIFLNRTTGRKILWVQGHGFQRFSDEECVDMLIDPVPNQTARRLMVVG